MAINYASLKATAERLIRENGRDINVVRRSRTPGDPAKPGRADDTTTTSLTVKGVLLFADLEQVDNLTVERGDQLAFISAQNVENVSPVALLEDYDYVEDSGVRWDIINKNVIEPGIVGSSRVLYILQLRQ